MGRLASALAIARIQCDLGESPAEGCLDLSLYSILSSLKCDLRLSTL